MCSCLFSLVTGPSFRNTWHVDMRNTWFNIEVRVIKPDCHKQFGTRWLISSSTRLQVGTVLTRQSHHENSCLVYVICGFISCNCKGLEIAQGSHQHQRSRCSESWPTHLTQISRVYFLLEEQRQILLRLFTQFCFLKQHQVQRLCDVCVRRYICVFLMHPFLLRASECSGRYFLLQSWT